MAKNDHIKTLLDVQQRKETAKLIAELRAERMRKEALCAIIVLLGCIAIGVAFGLAV